MLRWRAAPQEDCIFDRSFGWQSDDVVVAYHRQSGETHLLNFLSVMVLDILAAKPSDRVNVLAEVRAQLGDLAHDFDDGLVDRALRELDHAALIYPLEESARG